MWSASNPQIPPEPSHCSHSGQCSCSHQLCHDTFQQNFQTKTAQMSRKGYKMNGSLQHQAGVTLCLWNWWKRMRGRRNIVQTLNDCELLKLTPLKSVNRISCLHSRAEYATVDWMWLMEKKNCVTQQLAWKNLTHQRLKTIQPSECDRPHSLHDPRARCVLHLQSERKTITFIEKGPFKA